ncbi:MAG: PSD1 and planctomycete cytochrome C domain-containing protein [Planctomycetota bacterium]|nr:PSD1 and planctomycete cytochrome C domain-containing protein [Planctomycetota bacterium]
MRNCVSLVVWIGGFFVWFPNGAGLVAQDSLTADQSAFFEKHIRPVLVKECYSCHSADADELEGGLLLDTRDGIRKGGDTGPAVTPRSIRQSLLIKAIKHSSDKLQMPPEKKLPDAVIANFERWIEMGAPDPREGAANVAREEIDIEKGRRFWSFRPPQSTLPTVGNAQWPKSDIDRFLLAKLESKGLKPVADAEPHTFIRRLYFDLTGLPPTPEEVDEFVAAVAEGRKQSRDASDTQLPNSAIAAVVDKLLASPRYGERWGRHWLDVARYAESSGGATNFAYPHAWRYRDYVINAFNADKPYDQFIREQIAGDLLQANTPKQRAEHFVATGFLAIGSKSHSERNRQQFQMDLVDEQINATFLAFQSLTVACARCHDHKFDPIPQKDYYGLAGIFRNTETCYGTIRIIQSNHPSRLLELPEDADHVAALPPLTESRRSAIEKQIEDQRTRMSEVTGRDNFIMRIFMQSRITQLQSQLDQYDSAGKPKSFAMGVRNVRFMRPTYVLIRGEVDQNGERVSTGFPQVLATQQPRIGFRSSGRRELAEFLASKENPLTARVMANRIWLHLIGQGIVSTPDNFGASGSRPTHPKLLDYLAISFVENGWSVKKLIRSIVLSRAYQLSSQRDAKNYEADPDSILVWRIPKQRLEVEALRDTMLFLSGRLDERTASGSQVAQNGEGTVGFRMRGDQSSTSIHRTTYLPILRDQLPEVLTIFDFPDPSLISGERASTTIPSQSLYLMNNSFVIRQAEELAAKLMDASDDNATRVKRAYLLCYSRPASDSEVNHALHFLEEYGRDHSRRSTWAALCQAFFASAEFAQR